MKEKIKKIIKEITLDRVIKLSIVFVVLLVGFSFFYYYVIFLPQKEQAKLKQNQLAEEKLNICLTGAEKESKRLYLLNVVNCKTAECFNELGEGLDKMTREDKDECFRKYPQN